MSKKVGQQAMGVGAVLSPVETYVASEALGKQKEWKKTPYGAWVKRATTPPATKFPETKGTAQEGQQVVKAASDEAMMAAKEKEKKRLRAAAGRKSLIATSGRGVLEEATVKKKKLGA